MTCSFASLLILCRIFGMRATELQMITNFVILSGRYLKEVFLLQIARKELSKYFFSLQGREGERFEEQRVHRGNQRRGILNVPDPVWVIPGGSASGFTVF